MLNLFTICLHENITSTCFSSCDRKETGAWNFRTWSSSPWLAWTWHLMWLREARAAGVYHPIGLHGDDLTDSAGTLRTTSMTCMLCAIIMAPCKGGTTQVCSARDRCLCGRFLQACLLVTGSLCLRASLSFTVGSVPTVRAVFILWIFVQEQTSGTSSFFFWAGPSVVVWLIEVVCAGNTVCFPEDSLYSPHLHYSFMISVYFLELLASSCFGVIVKYFYSVKRGLEGFFSLF